MSWSAESAAAERASSSVSSNSGLSIPSGCPVASVDVVDVVEFRRALCWRALSSPTTCCVMVSCAGFSRTQMFVFASAAAASRNLFIVSLFFSSILLFVIHFSTKVESSILLVSMVSVS